MATITGTNVDDTLNGTTGSDTIDALAGEDTINAGDGDDIVYGGAHKDTLRGDAGNDTLIGGTGQDRLIGGTGNDLFVLTDIADSTISAQDIIQDFAQGQDRIDLRDLLGVTDLAWGGTTATANGVWYQQLSGTTTIVYIDVTGDAVADARIQVNGLYTLTAADFLGVAQAGVTPPQPVNDGAAVAEDSVLSAAGSVLANDSGTGPLTVTAVRFGTTNGSLGTALAGTYGSLTLNANGTYSYTLNNASAAVQNLGSGQTAQDVFTYTVTNAGGNATATLTVTISGANEPSNQPATIGGVATGSVGEDVTLSTSGVLTIVDPDPGQAALVPRSGVAGTYGTFGVNAAGAWTYNLANGSAAVQALAAGQTVTDTFTVTSVDGSASRNVVVSIAGRNDAPTIASTVNVQTGVGVAVGGTALGQDVDAGAQLGYSATQGAHGTVAINAGAGTWTYTPAAGYVGPDSFLITVNDGNGGSAQQTVNVTVNLVPNTAPKLAGIVLTALGPGTNTDNVVGMSMLPDGRMLLAGYGETATGGLDFGMARYNPNGSLDTSFGIGGIVTKAIGEGTGTDVINGVTLLADGKILAAGFATTKIGGKDYALLRYNADGTLDTTFGGGDGIVTTSLVEGTENDTGLSVTVQADGKILLAGMSKTSAGGVDFSLVRYNANGTIDTSFGGGDGKVITQIGAGTGGDVPHVVLVQPNGKIVVSGYATTATGKDFAVVRYNANGSIDGTFGGGDGKVTTNIGAGISDDRGYGMALLADGRIVLSGVAQTANGGDFALVRYNANGTLDTTFGGGDGIVVTPIGPGTGEDWGLNLLVMPDGRMLVCGYATTAGGGQDFALARYLADGSLDTSFGGGDGIVTVPLGPGANMDQAWDVELLADGRIVVSGLGETAAGGQDFALMRFLADGTPDSSFGGLRLPAVNAGAAFSYALPTNLFTDAEGGALTYAVTLANGAPLPAWLAFNAATKTLSGTPPAGVADPALRLVATDPQGASSGLNFTLNVNDAPADIQWNAVAPASGSSLPASRVATLGVTDPDSQGFTYSLVSGTGFAVSADGIVTRSGTQPANTTATIVVRVTDANGASTDESFDLITGSTAVNNPLPTTGESSAVLAGDDILYGLSGNDVLYGAAGNDTLFGQDGNDTLFGGIGNDVLNGGNGNDSFVFANGSGQDRIVGFTAGGTNDSINLSAVTNPDWNTFADVQAHLTQVGADTVVDLGNGNSITLVGVTATSLTAADFVL